MPREKNHKKENGAAKPKSMDEIEEHYSVNKQMWHDTMKFSERYPYKKALKIKDNLKPLEEYYKNKSKSNPEIKSILVLREDYITVAENVHNAGFNPLCLLPISDNNPLEGVKLGLDSLEYDVMRRSNYHLTLGEELYPLRDNDMIYVPEFTIFHNAQGGKMKVILPLASISVPPVKRPSLISMAGQGGKLVDTYSNDREKNAMHDRIETVFQIAHRYHHALVLPDFGCNEEQNPVHQVIDFFKEAMEKYPVKYIFFSVSAANHEKFHQAFRV